jgi:hypothetical protein
MTFHIQILGTQRSSQHDRKFNAQIPLITLDKGPVIQNTKIWTSHAKHNTEQELENSSLMWLIGFF